MRQMVCVLVAVLGLTAFSQTSLAADPSSGADAVKAASADKVEATRQVMRDLWTDHIFWVRNVVIATKDKNDAARKAAEAEVVANAKAIAGAVVPFYGQEASDQLFKLLAGHWGAIKAYLDATDTGNKAGMEQAKKALYDNAQQIADFLSKANPNWPQKVMTGLLTAHATHHIMQIDDIYAGEYDKEGSEVWPTMRRNMNALGNELADGLAKQFPDKF